MRIGQDVSIEECRAEGYMVMDYPVYEFKRNPRTTDCRFTCSLPECSRDKGVGIKVIYLDMLLNWDDVWKMYQEYKEGIDSFIRDTYKNEPNPYTLLDMAATVNAYCGIE